ncbi:MAG: proprotein convertase P-domain-containing protein, partial [Lewinella sp.]|nr:proprotein convertase P-domain-containing protein [Lewinella sp.]
DDAGGDAGTFLSFTLNICTSGEPPCPGYTSIDGNNSNEPIPETGTSGDFVGSDALVLGYGIIGMDAEIASVEVDLSHSFDSDLDISLVSPSGIEVILSSDNGGEGDDYRYTTFDDNAATSIVAAAAPFTGTFLPEQSINGTLAGEQIHGSWMLKIVDDAGGDAGTFHRFTLNFCANGVPTPPFTCVSTPQSFSGDNVGEPIPETGTAGDFIGSTASVTSSGIIGVSAGITSVEINLIHTWVDDLDITLVSPQGTELNLSSDNGGDGDNYTGTVFQDGGADITSAAAPFTGIFAPEGGAFYDAFYGQEVQGDWMLKIVDDAGGDAGTFLGFTINVCVNCDGNTEPPAITCHGITVDLNGQGTIPLDANELVTIDMEYCPVQTITLDPTDINCAQLGDVVPVLVTVSDLNNLSSQCTALVTVDGLPCGWMTWDDHIDCPGSSADYEVTTETFLLTSSDCSHAPYSPFDEEYAYVKTTLCGDGEIIAQVTDLNGLGKAWAGIVMRENNDPGSKKFQVMTGLDYLQHRVDWRTNTGGTNQSQSFSRYGQHWLRIVRTGNLFEAYTSYDGQNWGIPVNTQSITMPDCIEAGLIVTNVPYATNVTASFNQVEVTPPSVPKPPQPEAPVPIATNAMELTAYPNPTSGQLTVNLSAFLDREATLEVMDINGQLLLQKQLGLVENSTEQLDLSSYAAGMYFVRVLTNDGTTAVQRVILQPRP